MFWIRIRLPTGAYRQVIKYPRLILPLIESYHRQLIASILSQEGMGTGAIGHPWRSADDDILVKNAPRPPSRPAVINGSQAFSGLVGFLDIG